MTLLLFLGLTYYEFNVGNDNFEYLGNTIYQIPRTPLYSNLISNSWFFIQFPYLDKSNCEEKLSHENSITLDFDSIINSRTCLAFLTLDNITNLETYYKTKNEKVIIRPLLISEKLHHNSNKVEDNYIARFHSSFSPPKNLTGNLIKLSNEVYLYQPPEQRKGIIDEILNEILSIPSLRSISPQKKTKFMNRWNSAFIQKNEWPGGYDIDNYQGNISSYFIEGDLRVNRYLNDKGLNGNGQIITIVDSGLDLRSPYFEEKSDKPFEYEKIDMSRRKVVYYSYYGNYHETSDIHGTYIAGIVSGSPIIDDKSSSSEEKFLFSKRSLYNGVAPSSKVSIVDITENNENGSSILTYSALALGDAMGKVNSKIALCAWGTPSNIEQNYYFDQLAEHNPSRLFVFAAGNEGPNYMTITTPGEAKNALTVGALEPLLTALYETARIYKLSGDDDGVEHELELLPFGRDLFYVKDSSGEFAIKKGETTRSLSNDKVFVTDDSEFCSSLDNASPLAVIFVGDSFNEPLCNSSSFSFPIFATNITQILSYKFVNIWIAISENVDRPTALTAAQYSSNGPNFVGIQKPDVVAPGSSIFSADSTFVSASDGTSNAAAYVAGAAALVYEYFERGFYPSGSSTPGNSFEPRADLVRALIVASADPLNKSSSRTPDCSSGNGVVNLENVVTFRRTMKVFNQIRVSNNQHFFLRFHVNKEELNSGIDLRIALAFRDPASTSNTIAIHANIDMYLVLPNGTKIFGNHRPEETEERFSTVERILIYNKEMKEIDGDVYELHIVTGSGFSDLPHTSIFSLIISGPFVNSETSSYDSYRLLRSSNFPFEQIAGDVGDFTFIQTMKRICYFPSYGPDCQHRAVEIKPENETKFHIWRNTAAIVYVRLPLNYTFIILTLRRQPTFDGRLSMQFAIDNIYEDGKNYPFILSVYEASTAVSLTRSLFGPNTLAGIRIANLVGTDLNVTASITYETATPDETPTQSVIATMPKDVLINLSVSYVFFGLFLAALITFSVLICLMKKKIEKQNEIILNKRLEENYIDDDVDDDKEDKPEEKYLDDDESGFSF